MSLTTERFAVVRTLIESAPDSAVRDLELALRSQMSDDGLTKVREMIDAEVWDRKVRNAVFLPLQPLLAPRADGFEQTTFPAAALPQLWRALKVAAPTPLAIALASLTVNDDGDYYPPSYDECCREAAKGIAARHKAFLPVIQTLEAFRPGAAAEFIGFLAVMPFARTAINRLPSWIRNMNSEHSAAVRLLFKDAVAISEDASPRLMEVMLAHLREPWMILRIISVVTHRANDRYVAGSEMASFCQRILDDIEKHLNQVRLFDFDDGPEAAVATAKAVALAAAAAAEFEGCLELDRDGPWGTILGRHKSFLASQTEGYLKKCGKLVSDALPTSPVRVGTSRGDPRLDQAPDPRLVRRAMAGLTFFDRSRKSATLGGYGSVRAKVCEDITHGLDTYMEDILAAIRDGDVPDEGIARAYLDVVADFMGLTQDLKAARIVRRRAAAAA